MLQLFNPSNLLKDYSGSTVFFPDTAGDITKIRGNKKSLYNTNLSIGGEYIEAASISSEIQVKDQVVTVDATLSKDSLFGTRSVTISGKHSSRGARVKASFLCKLSRAMLCVLPVYMH